MNGLDNDATARFQPENDKVVEFCGPADITQQTTDAIVNAANSSLLGGGGVDGAIHRAGGPAILEECRRIVAKIASLPEGKAVITGGGRLAARYVIHTVGPVYRDGKRGEAEKLASCHHESIRLAEEYGLKSLSFPAISTGAFGYPVSEAAKVAVASAAESLVTAIHLNLVRFVLFDEATLQAYAEAGKHLRRSSSLSSYKSGKASS